MTPRPLLCEVDNECHELAVCYAKWGARAVFDACCAGHRARLPQWSANVVFTSLRPNPHEQAARSKKIIALLGVVPAGASRAENRIVAEWLGRMSVADRAVFALLAKVNSPSETTWRELVAAVRARVPASELLGASS